MNNLSTDKILNVAAAVALASLASPVTALSHLDIGSGTGALISLLQSKCSHIESTACDYTDELMKISGQRVDIADLNCEALPYEANSFDLVTCTEVVEHLENYRRVIRDIFRVTRAGGVVVLSTPNILNLNSRLRNLFFGFANLFGPLPVSRSESYSTGGHITPVSFFYLAHTLAESGFTDIRLEVDKSQRSSMPKLALLWPLIALRGYLIKRKEISKYKTIDETNKDITDKINSMKILLGRTIVVSARKPA